MAEILEPDDVRERAMEWAVSLHHELEFNGTEADNARLIGTASAIRRWLVQPESDPAIADLQTRLAALEAKMTAAQDALADLDLATNEVAAELDDLRGQIATTDAALADRIGAAASRLRTLAADPTNPVPPAEPGEPGA